MAKHDYSSFRPSPDEQVDDKGTASRPGYFRSIHLNDYDQEIDIVRTDLLKEPSDTKVDLVVANLYHNLLADLLTTPSFWQAKLYIVAGFIPSMEKRSLAALPPHRVRMIERRRSDRWCLWGHGTCYLNYLRQSSTTSSISGSGPSFCLVASDMIAGTTAMTANGPRTIKSMNVNDTQSVSVHNQARLVASLAGSGDLKGIG